MNVIFSAKVPNGTFAGRELTENGEMIRTRGKGFMKPLKQASGLLFLVSNQLYEYVHILVARTFIPIEKELSFVLHKDGNFEHNHYSNLVWSDHPEIDLSNFKTIPGFSNYKISPESVIKSYKNPRKPRILSQNKTETYIRVTITGDDSLEHCVYVHRLVAITYLSNPNSLSQVDHINRNKYDNNLKNLRWANSSEQARNRSVYKKCKSLYCYDLNGKFHKVFKSSVEAVKSLQLGIKASNINICASKNTEELKFSSGGFKWMYETEERPYILQKGELATKIVGTFGTFVLDYPSYQITNFGNAIDRKGFLLRRVNPTCPRYNLCKNGKSRNFQAHVLVALFFVLGRTKEMRIVDHLDENRTNPRFDNLQWVTYSENSSRAIYKQYKSVNKMDKVTGKILRKFESVKGARENAGSGVSACLKKRTKSSNGFKWEYSD